MNYILGREGTKMYNLDTHEKDYSTKITVSQDVIDFLELHDVEMGSNETRIFIMNKVRYIYLGFDFKDESNIEKISKYQHIYDSMYNRIANLIREEIRDEKDK